MSLVLGIDPGFYGALALIEKSTHKVIEVKDMPLNSPPGGKHSVNLAALTLFIDCYSRDIDFAVIEDVGAMTYVDKSGQLRGQGAAASFSFGKSTGEVHGVLAAFNVKKYLVKPSTWKMLMGVSADKGSSIAKAKKLFPFSSSLLTLKKHDGRAEALLLALFGAERFK